MNEQENKGRNLLLISNSTVKHYDNTTKAGWLGAYRQEFLDFVEKSGKEKIMFVPYARPGGLTHEEYTSVVEDKFKKMGFDHLKVYGPSDLRIDSCLGKSLISGEYAVLIGGGNTWQLLKTMQKNGLLQDFMKAIESGVYMAGISAGTNIFGKDISPTNDKVVTLLNSYDGFNAHII